MSNEDFQSPVWASEHQAVSSTIQKVIDDAARGLERLNHYEFDAPWHDQQEHRTDAR